MDNYSTSLGYAQSLETRAMASGQCLHASSHSKGTRRGKPLRQCTICGKYWVIGGKPKMNIYDRAIQILPYVKKGMGKHRIAKELGITHITVFNARKLLKNYMEIPKIEKITTKKGVDSKKKILSLLHLTNQEIADKLGLVYGTVVKHKRQLGITNQKYNHYKRKKVMVAGNGS